MDLHSSCSLRIVKWLMLRHYGSREDREFAQAQSGLLALPFVAIFVIYVVLGILYEGFIHPLTILSALPFAALGALLTLWIFGKDLGQRQLGARVRRLIPPPRHDDFERPLALVSGRSC